jgi:hypothetical protein
MKRVDLKPVRNGTSAHVKVSTEPRLTNLSFDTSVGAATNAAILMQIALDTTAQLVARKCTVTAKAMEVRRCDGMDMTWNTMRVAPWRSIWIEQGVNTCWRQQYEIALNNG